MFVCQNVEFPNIIQKSWFELNIDIEFEFQT
jgi:hypothetical protein